MYDSLEYMRKLDDKITGSMWVDLKRSRYWKSNTPIARIYEKPLSIPMFTLNDSLYIFNTVKDSLLIYDHSGNFVFSKPVSFHLEEKLGDIDQKEIIFLTDDKAGKVYTLERKTTRWILNELNIVKGTLNAPIQLPDFAGMTNIRVHNNAVFFLYPEKKYPYYTRLYRYQL
jgi:hypothetical protein